MRKRKVIIIIFVSVFLLLSISYTYAYYVMEEKTKSVFTFGNVKLELIQSTLKDGVYVPVLNNESINITNTSSLSRRVEVKNIGKNPMYLRLIINIKANGNIIDSNEIMNINVLDNWTYKDGYYYYNYSLEPNTLTSELMNEIVFDNAKILRDYQGNKINMEIKAQAVQSEHNGNNVFDAVGWPD